MKAKNTKNELLNELQRFCEDVGYLPSSTDFRRLPTYPSPSKIFHHFGTWKNYIDSFENKSNYPEKKDAKFKLYVGSSNVAVDRENFRILHKRKHDYLFDLLVRKFGLVLYSEMLNQIIYSFNYNNKNYIVCFFDEYVENYLESMEMIYETMEENGYEIINLNGKYEKRDIIKVFKSYFPEKF